MTRPDDLAAHCIADVLRLTPQARPLGNRRSHPRRAASRTAPQGHNVARIAALRAGLPVTTPGVTVNRYCNSGLQAIVQAAHMVIQEGVEAAIGGGVESISLMVRDNAPNPWLLEHHPAVYMAMGETAEVVAKRYGVTRRVAGRIRARQPAAHRARAGRAASSSTKSRRST